MQVRVNSSKSLALFQRNLLKYYYADLCDGAGRGMVGRGERIYADEYKQSYVPIEICWILFFSVQHIPA